MRQATIVALTFVSFLTVFIAAVQPAEASQAKFIVRSDPPGATVYTRDAQGAWRLWGTTPFELKIAVPNRWTECVPVGTVRVQWASGANARNDTLSVCPKDTSREYLFSRPEGEPGAELDLIASERASGLPPARLSIFVGPQIRDGFVDVDGGVLDSIRDITAELLNSKRFSVVRSPEAAKLQLLVVARRIAGQGDAVGVPIAGMLYTASVKRRAIDTLLKVGTYQKPTTSEDTNSDTWTGAAQRVVKDVIAWVDANRVALATSK